jgi:hypothetical protein
MMFFKCPDLLSNCSILGHFWQKDLFRKICVCEFFGDWSGDLWEFLKAISSLIDPSHYSMLHMQYEHCMRTYYAIDQLSSPQFQRAKLWCKKTTVRGTTTTPLKDFLRSLITSTQCKVHIWKSENKIVRALWSGPLHQCMSGICPY